ncbi:MAG TPA: MATE family efflux transporter, partial [Magnetospirillaceae bacterium]|nr:MATE family efflux transporter [Magnetospirillaceae bacterium]
MTLPPTSFGFVGHWRVLAMATPIVLANLTQPILSTVDIGIAGHLGSGAALGGVALGGLFFNVIFWGLGFFRMSTTALVAQAHGARDPAAMRGHLWRALGLAGLAGLVLVAVKALLVPLAMDLLGGGAEVRQAGISYAAARLWSAPFALANYVILGFLLGSERATVALVVQALINLVNIGAAFLLVRTLDLGIAGLGAATATADVAGFAVGMAILWRMRLRALPPLDWRRLWAGPAIKRLVAVNGDIFLRTMCLVACFVWFTHAGAGLGDLVLAANALLLNFQTISSYLLDGFAQAAESLVGGAIGAGDRQAYRQTVRISTLWAAAMSVLIGLAYLIAGPALIAFLTDSEETRAAANAYLPWAIALPLVSVWAFQLDGIFIGATRTRDLRNGMMIAVICYLAMANGFAQLWGNGGLWGAFLGLMAARTLVLAALYP